MKKFWLVVLSLLLAVTMAVGLVACGETGKDEVGGGDGNSEVAEVKGVYTISLDPLMPLTFYFRIDDDGKFMFSNSEEFSVDKNSGTVSKTSTGYLMVYTTINNAAANGETTKFTKESDGRLKFEGNFYYGSTAPSSPMEDEDTGETVTFYAVPYTGEDSGETDVTLEKGLYYGTAESAMGDTTITYHYYLNLREDGKFTSFTTFSMMGANYSSYDYGTYTMMGSIARLTSEVYKDYEDETKALTESVTASADSITAEVALSAMAKSAGEITLTKAEGTPAAFATFTASKASMMGGSYEMTLTVYADGSYEYVSKDAATDEVGASESGFLGLNLLGGAYLLPEGVTEGLTGAFDSDTGALTGLKFSMVTGTPRTELEFTMVTE